MTDPVFVIVAVTVYTVSRKACSTAGSAGDSRYDGSRRVCWADGESTVMWEVGEDIIGQGRDRAWERVREGVLFGVRADGKVDCYLG